MSVFENEVWFYIGTYSSEEEVGIQTAVMNTDTGELRLVGGIKGIENPSYLALSTDSTVLYAASEKGEGEILMYQINPETRELHLLDRKSTGGGAPCYVQLTPDGKHLLASNYTGANINVFAVGDQGALAEMTGEVKHTGSGTDPDRQDAPHPHSAVSSLDNHHVYVSDLGLDKVFTYRLEDNGTLTEEGATELPAQSGPRHLIFHPNGQLAYGINELNSTVTAYGRNPEDGQLEIIGHVSTLPEDFTGENTGGDIRISPCGRFVYASNRGHNSLVHYNIDELTGELSPIEWVTVKGETPRNVAVVPGGYILVSNQDSNNIVQFAIEADTGKLLLTGNELTLNRPVCVMAEQPEPGVQ